MRITEVSTLKLRFSMATPMADAIHYMPERNLLLVQITTDDGLVDSANVLPTVAPWTAWSASCSTTCSHRSSAKTPFTSSGSGVGWHGVRINAERPAC